MSAQTYGPPTNPPPFNPDTRKLPEGWITEFDPNYKAWFYVDTNKEPPVVTWIHPLGKPGDSHPPPPPYDTKPASSGNTNEGGFGFPQANVAPSGSSQSPSCQQSNNQIPSSSGPQDRGLLTNTAGLAAAAKLGSKLFGGKNKQDGNNYGNYGGPPPQGGGYYPQGGGYYPPQQGQQGNWPPPSGYPGYGAPQGRWDQPPQGNYGPPAGAYGGYPQYGGSPQPQVVYVQENKKKTGGMGAGAGLAMGAGAGLLGGLLVADAIDDAYDDGYDNGYNDDMGGDW